MTSTNEPDTVGKQEPDLVGDNLVSEFNANSTREVLQNEVIPDRPEFTNFDSDDPPPPPEEPPPPHHPMHGEPVHKIPPPGELADDNPFDDPDEVHNYQFAEWLHEDTEQNANCKTLPLTCCTWLTFLFVIFFYGNIADNFRMRECLTGAIEEIQVYHTISGFSENRIRVVRFHEIASVAEMWTWIEDGLVPAMYSNPAKPGFVRTFNQVIGAIQLRETRLETGDCNVGDALALYYRQSCYGKVQTISSVAYGTGAENWWGPDKAFTPGYGLGDKLSEFNQKHFFAWLDVRRPVDGQARAENLKNATWIDSGSNKLELLIAFFNAEIQAYAHLRLTFTFERDGFVSQELDVRPLWAPVSIPWYFWFVDILWWLCVLKFIANSVQKVVDDKSWRGCCSRCCPDFWLFLDWLGILVALAIIVNGFIFPGELDTLAGYVGRVGEGPEPPPTLANNGTMAQIETYNAGNNIFYANIAEILQDLEFLIMWNSFSRLGMYWYAMIFLIRFFKGFRGQPRIMEITSTLSSASADLLHFGIIFLVVFLNFGIAGYALFGAEVTDWSSLDKALHSSISLAYGRVDWESLYRVAPYSAIVWLFGYAVAIVLLLLNMLLAIIADHYGSVYHKIHDKGYGMVEQLLEVCADTCWNLKYTMRFIYRIVWASLPPRIQARACDCKCFQFTCFPELEEQNRLPIPYERIKEECWQDPNGILSEQFLTQKCGCDPYTAEYLYTKCSDEVLKQHPEKYPLEKLFDEFDESMKLYYHNMDTYSNDLRSWFNDKTRTASKMIPRQDKLYKYASIIEEADIPGQKPPQPPEAS